MGEHNPFGGRWGLGQGDLHGSIRHLDPAVRRAARSLSYGRGAGADSVASGRFGRLSNIRHSRPKLYCTLVLGRSGDGYAVRHHPIRKSSSLPGSISLSISWRGNDSVYGDSVYRRSGSSTLDTAHRWREPARVEEPIRDPLKHSPIDNLLPVPLAVRYGALSLRAQLIPTRRSTPSCNRSRSHLRVSSILGPFKLVPNVKRKLSTAGRDVCKPFHHSSVAARLVGATRADWSAPSSQQSCPGESAGRSRGIGAHCRSRKGLLCQKKRQSFWCMVHFVMHQASWA